jgi:tetratricopeptide (TPR) repeat protein
MHKPKIIIPVLIILSITFASFLPSLRNGFVTWDDDAYVMNNQLIKELSWSNIGKIFASPQENLCKPLVFLFFALEYHFFKLDPFFYHLTNLLFHLANCLLVFWFIFLITDKLGISFITALLFGIHPLQVESVAWVFQLKNMLSGFFFLWALILYLYYCSWRLRKYYYLALLSFLLSLLSKPMGIALPLVLLCLDYLKGRRLKFDAYLDKIPFVIASFGIVMMSLAFNNLNVNSQWNSFRPFSSVPYQIIFYLEKAFLPLRLSCLYPDITKLEVFWFPFKILSPLLLFFLTLAIIFSGKQTKKIIFGSLFFLLLLFPVLVSHTYEATYGLANHFTYLALIGIFYLAAEGFFWLLRQRTTSFPVIRVSLILVFLLVVGTLSFMTYQKTKVWKDSVTLWSDALKNYPDNIVAYNNRGLAYLKKGEYEKARLDFNRTISSDVNYYGRDKVVAGVFYNLNLSGLYNSTGKYTQTIALLENAIKNDPNYGYNYYNNLAIAYASAGKTKEAIALLKKAIENNNLHDKSAFCYNLALIYKGMGNYHEAQALFEKTIESNSSYADAYYGLGKLCESNHEMENAISYYKKAIIYNPSDENFYNDLAAAYYSIGKYKKAIPLLTKALEINPNFIDAYNNLGVAYCAVGRNKEAIAALKKVIQLNPKDGEAHSNIALAYYYDKNYDLAIRHCDIAIELGYKVDPGLLGLLKPHRK